MKTRIFALALAVLFLMPCVVRAEVVIQLMEVITMSPLPGDDPLDGPNQDPSVPTRPTSFHATIDGHFLRVTKQDANIPSAQVAVVNASNGGLVLNQLMTDSMEETISNNGVYVLHIETDGGALVGQFIVQQ
jgi:hypothetical protein